MLKWNANFHIPNSGVQAAVVYTNAYINDSKIHVDFYADESKSIILFSKDYDLPENVTDIDKYLLTLEEFNLYEKV